MLVISFSHCLSSRREQDKGIFSQRQVRARNLTVSYVRFACVRRRSAGARVFCDCCCVRETVDSCRNENRPGATSPSPSATWNGKVEDEIKQPEGISL